MILIADTSGLLATVNTDEPEYEPCRKAIAQCSHLVVSPLVLAELDYLVAGHLGEDTAMAVADHIAAKAGEGAYSVPTIDHDLIAATRPMRAQYRSFAIGLTDAVNVVLAARYSTTDVLTLDRRHFRSIAPISGPERAFRLLPDDLE
ncbi:PIN domain-containing protein [Glycomyces tenuis]|uniref:PIN domain-containing protein n=1 Tax=Glycomyces tenuis TaxID=58116 RepID=UPI00041DE0EF|nr:PIN domain-containing protein [Glycomyces tenuis]